VNILLTGGTGYIGSHTAVVLIEAGHNVVLFDNLSNSRRDVVDRLKKITQQDTPFVEGDVRDTALLSKTIKAHKVDAVIHFAGLKAVGESVKNPLKYFDNNVGGTISLLDAMQENEVKKLVFSSSATVYGIPKYLPYDENHSTSAINPYGRSKLHIEEILSDLAESDKEWSIAVLRYFNPVGAHETAMIGELPTGIPNNLMPYLVQVASGRLQVLSIFGDDYPTKDGTGERDYIHVVDLAEGHLAASKFVLQEKGLHAINLGTGNSTSVFELVRSFERVTNRNIPLKIVSRRPGDLAAYYAKAEKAKLLLGWEAKRSIDDMCISAWRWEESLK
jgi:UDP-glucose 4-epimerase